MGLQWSVLRSLRLSLDVSCKFSALELLDLRIRDFSCWEFVVFVLRLVCMFCELCFWTSWLKSGKYLVWENAILPTIEA